MSTHSTARTPLLWSTHEVAELTGTTSRTLRHYDAIGLLPPTQTRTNGYRYYDEAALRRLQRILLLRELGLSLPDIAKVLTHETTEQQALATHLDLLTQERERLNSLINSVKFTITSLKEKEPMTHHTDAAAMFDGFDHTQYKEEVEERWGTAAYAQSDSWWRSQSDDEKAAFMRTVADLNAAWTAATADPKVTPGSQAAQDLASRHVAWLRGFQQQSKAVGDADFVTYVRNVTQMYPQDDRFAANYGGTAGAQFVADAVGIYLDRTV